MKGKRPADRRKFANEWDEIGYLYDKLLYWLYGRADPERARPYAERLERLLPRADPDHEAIFGEECRSLACEAKGDLGNAIQHRENEIRLIRRLHEISRGKPWEEIALKDYDYEALSDRLDLLAMLYHDSGNADKAIRILRGSKRLCGRHGVPFDGEDTLREYLQEKGDSREEARLPRVRRISPARRG
jgi:tetratricopeptide (TPR) repeat protein